MSAAGSAPPEDHFLCSVQTEPGRTTSGHSFCKTCTSQRWNIDHSSRCPDCKKVSHTRPELDVNAVASETTAGVRRSGHQEATSSSSLSVPCEFCSGTDPATQEICPGCLASYCETPPTKSGVRKHQLMDPAEELEGRMCPKHNKRLELFCQTDQMCVCMFCTVLNHRTHDVVTLEEECEEKKVELGKTEDKIQQMIQRRQQKIEEIRRSVELSQGDADRVIADGVEVFSCLKESVERQQAELIDSIREKQRTMERAFIGRLEQEVWDLKKWGSDLEKLSHCEEPFHLLQNFPLVSPSPATRDWTGVSVHPASYEGTVVRAVKQLEETLSYLKKKMSETEKNRVQQDAANVSLDPDTEPPGFQVCCWDN